MTRHSLKLNDRYFDAVRYGIKTFEIRKNDRDYKVGDLLIFSRVNDEGKYIDSDGNPITDEGMDGLMKRSICMKSVCYILKHEDFPAGIPEGYCVMGVKDE